MAEVQKLTFEHSQVAEALVKQAGLHDGLWALSVEFGLVAANVAAAADNYNPAAIVPIVRFGLEKTDKPTNLSVDAAVINPTQKLAKSPKRKQTK